MFYLGESQATLCRHSTQAVRSSSAHKLPGTVEAVTPGFVFTLHAREPYPCYPLLGAGCGCITAASKCFSRTGRTDCDHAAGRAGSMGFGLTEEDESWI